jgi:hypothetical protein
MTDPWRTASNKILEDTTDATVKMQELFVIILARKHQGTVIKVSHLQRILIPTSLLQAELWKQRIPSKESVYSPLWFVLVYGASSSWLGEANRDSKVQGPK